MAFVVGADPTTPVASTTDGRLHKLRQTYRDYAGNVWMYAKAASAITQYNYVIIDEGGNAYNGTKTLVDEGHQVAIAQATFAASDYGWFAISGSSGLLVSVATCAADTTLYTSATAGVMDDSSTSQTELRGIVILTATTTSGNATCQIAYSGIVVGAAI